MQLSPDSSSQAHLVTAGLSAYACNILHWSVVRNKRCKRRFCYGRKFSLPEQPFDKNFCAFACDIIDIIYAIPIPALTGDS